jgi:hypothetical protein
MFLVLWEFEVKPECEGRFQKVYGPGGDWAQLFRRNPHYRETRLLRDPAHPCTFLTLDFWDSRDTYESFQQQSREAYLALDKTCEGLTLRECHLGSYEQIPQL